MNTFTGLEDWIRDVMTFNLLLKMVMQLSRLLSNYIIYMLATKCILL